MKKYLPILICSIILVYSAPDSHAIDKNPIEFTKPQQETRYQTLIEELRCVVCQNQSIADSNAELAQDMRELIRKQIIEGKTDQQITEFLVDRYGDFVLYTPPLKPTTYLLWLGPLVLLIIAVLTLLYWVRRHVQTTPHSTSLTEEEHHQLQQLFPHSSKKD